MNAHHDDAPLTAAELALAGVPDPAFDGFLFDIGDHLDHESERAGVPWDFAAMLARARTIDPTAVTEQAVREAELDEPVISLAQRRTHRITRDDPQLAQLIEDVRAATEHDAALRMHGISTAPVAQPRPHARTSRVLIAVLAFAAAVVLLFGAIEGVRVFELGGRPADEAVHQDGSAEAPVHEAIVDDGVTARRSPERSRSSASEAATPAPIEVAPNAVIPDEPAPLEPEAKVASRSRRKPTGAPTVAAPPEPTLGERQAALDRDAHAAWKAGDLATAQDKFEALITLSGKSRLADLAWGDLFTLARRRGDTAGETAAWKRYLAAWPRGRFADDARAGLCRRDAKDRVACWREYLEDFPSGVYRTQAEREIGSPP